MISTEGSPVLFSSPRLGRPTTLSDDLTTEIKLILNISHIAECAISCKAVISVRNGVLADRCLAKIVKNWREHYVIY